MALYTVAEAKVAKPEVENFEVDEVCQADEVNEDFQATDEDRQTRVS